MKRPDEERPVDRMRRLCEEKGVPWKETTRPGRRGLIFFGSAKGGGKPKEKSSDEG